MAENPKKAHGALKPSLHYAPMNVMPSVARVFELGASKYGLKNWREQPVDVSTYYDAALRHLIEYFENGVDADPESNQNPLAHVIACCMIVLDCIERDAAIDDRNEVEVLHPQPAEETPILDPGNRFGDVPFPSRNADPFRSPIERLEIAAGIRTVAK